MRGDGADAVARDIEGEVDRALPGRQTPGGRGQGAEKGQVQGLLAELEALAVGEVLAEMARLQATRQLAQGEQNGVAAARMGLLDAVELWSRAHAARLDAQREQEEGAGG